VDATLGETTEEFGRETAPRHVDFLRVRALGLGGARHGRVVWLVGWDSAPESVKHEERGGENLAVYPGILRFPPMSFGGLCFTVRCLVRTSRVLRENGLPEQAYRELLRPGGATS
jgi:hypothetical protein